MELHTVTAEAQTGQEIAVIEYLPTDARRQVLYEALQRDFDWNGGQGSTQASTVYLQQFAEALELLGTAPTLQAERDFCTKALKWMRDHADFSSGKAQIPVLRLLLGGREVPGDKVGWAAKADSVFG